MKWYPLMNSGYRETCFFITTSKDHPIHLYDAYTGDLVQSYKGYNHLDELTNAYSLSFNLTGDKIYAGYKNMIMIFDITRPGRDCEMFKTTKTNKSKIGQKGILSTIEFNPTSNLYAV